MKTTQLSAACAAFLLYFGAAHADEPAFVAVTSDFRATRSIPPKTFDAVKLPIKLRDLVALWGRAYRSELSGGGSVYWRCTDGRVAMSGSVSDPEQLLTDGNLPDTYGDYWLKFLSKEESARMPLPGFFQIR